MKERPSREVTAPAESELRILAPCCGMMKYQGDLCPCCLEGMLRVAGRPWSIALIGTLGNHGRLRFGRLQQALGDISPKTLTARLAELQQHGLVTREAFAEIPPRVEYALSSKGTELYQLLRPLMAWAEKVDHGQWLPPQG